MAILSDDSSIRSKILPSVWMGYTLRRSEIMGQELPFKDKISTKENIPQEWMDEMYGAFQNGSLAHFYDKYLGRNFTAQNHEQILLKANEILKKNLPELKPTDDRLTALASLDVVHNADEYGHHLFQTACFLKEQNQLPKECRFLFWRKINPALYEEKDLFETAQKFLLEPTQKIPNEWAQRAFYRWIHMDDSAAYLSQMKKIAAIEFILASNATFFLESAVKNYVHEHHIPDYKKRPRFERRSWRGHRE